MANNQAQYAIDLARVKRIVPDVRGRALPNSNLFNPVQLILQNPGKHKLCINNDNTYYYFIMRVANYFQTDLITPNNTYNIWERPRPRQVIQNNIRTIRQAYGNNNNFNLIICHMCVPIRLNYDGVYYYKKLIDINNNYTTNFIENSVANSLGDTHNVNFTPANGFNDYGRYNWNNDLINV